MAILSHEVLTRLKCCPCIVALETHAVASFFVISEDADSYYVGRGTFLLIEGCMVFLSNLGCPSECTAQCHMQLVHP